MWSVLSSLSVWHIGTTFFTFMKCIASHSLYVCRMALYTELLMNNDDWDNKDNRSTCQLNYSESPINRHCYAVVWFNYVLDGSVYMLLWMCFGAVPLYITFVHLCICNYRVFEQGSSVNGLCHRRDMSAVFLLSASSKTQSGFILSIWVCYCSHSGWVVIAIFNFWFSWTRSPVTVLKGWW